MPIEFCRLDQTHQACGALARSPAAHKQPIFPTQCNRAHRVLHRIVVNRDIGVVQMHSERRPAPDRVVNRLGRHIRVRQLQALVREPTLELIEQGRALLLADAQSLTRPQALHLPLNRVEIGNAPHRLSRNLTVIELMRFIELAPGMRPAARLLNRPASKQCFVTE